MSLFNIQINFDKSALGRRILDDVSSTIAELFDESIEVSEIIQRQAAKERPSTKFIFFYSLYGLTQTLWLTQKP